MYAYPSSDRTKSLVAHAASKLDHADRVLLEDVLRWDLLSEYDARFLSGHLKSLDLELTQSFRDYEREWAKDEEQHYQFFRAAYDGLWGLTAEFESELKARKPDFEPIAHLLEDEFSIACLGAYDELATVRAFSANIENYDKLGAEFGKLVRRVIADEARHYYGFLTIIREEHAHRVSEASEVIQRIRSTEGTSYGNTFVLDHDDPIFTDKIYNDAESVLLKHIAVAS